MNNPSSMTADERPLPALVRKAIIPNPQGLHARPVMKFVDTAGQFQSSVLVRKGTRVVDGKNPMEMMLLEAGQGTELELQADGPDAAEVLDALTRLVADGFGEM
jgi:phosphocarrier protein HPr